MLSEMTVKTAIKLTILSQLAFAINAHALGAAELRKQDRIAQERNIRIIHSAPLSITPITLTQIYKQRTYSVISEAQLISLDQQLRAKNFANEYKYEGCYAKSYLISYELSRVGIQHSKIFISGKKFGDIRVNTTAKPIQFEYHVSPVVLVETRSGKIKPYVLDLSFFPKPVSMNQWLWHFYQDSDATQLSNFISGPEQIDPTWISNKENPYEPALLYRFETEIDALNINLEREKLKRKGN
jgi:hypothetical protein